MRVGIRVNYKIRNKLFDGFRLFMIGKESSHFLKLGNSYKNGIDLKAIQKIQKLLARIMQNPMAIVRCAFHKKIKSPCASFFSVS